MVYNIIEGGSEMKTKEKIEARRIRVEEQLPLNVIAKRLGVAKSTVSLWVRDLSLPPEVAKQLNMVGVIKGAKIRHDDARAIRIQYQQAGQKMAKKYRNDPFFMTGCMMHWAEGAKDKNMVSISNTDSHFLRLWWKFIQQFFDIHPTDIALVIHCYLNNGKTKRQIESYWLKQLSLPRSCLRKTTVVTSHRFSTGAKKNRHPYGVAYLKLGSTEVIQNIWGAIKSLADIDDDDKWLD